MLGAPDSLPRLLTDRALRVTVESEDSKMARVFEV